MKELTRMGVEELRKRLPVLDDDAQRKVYGGCGDYGGGTDNTRSDCLYQVIASVTGKRSFDVLGDYASFLVAGGMPVSDAYNMATKGVRSSDADKFIASYGFSEGYSTAGDGKGEVGIAIFAGNGSGHAVKIIGKAGSDLVYVDVQDGNKMKYISVDDPSIYALYTKK